MGMVLLSVRGPLEDGRAAVRRAQTALLDGDVDAALTELSEARELFGRGADGTRGVLGLPAGAVPLLGRNVDVARAIADAGVSLTGSAIELLDAIEALPGGMDALAPSGGRFPLDSLSSLQAPAAAAAQRAADALEAVDSSPDGLLLSPVARARWDAEIEVADTAQTLATTAGLIRGMPAFGGAEEPRRYLVFAENPAELRGTGGLWGAYSILTMDRGLPEFGSFLPIQRLREDLDLERIPEPNPDYLREYAQYRAPTNWRNQNITPDFPSAARAALGAWEVLTGERLDGVMSVDPFALRELLKVTGTVDVPELRERLTPSNVVDVLANETYTRFDTPEDRKDNIGEAAKAALDAFLHMRGRGLERLQALARAAEGGHLNLYVSDPSFQASLAATDVGGTLDAPQGDLLMALVSNGGENKIDYFVGRTVEYEVLLGGDRQAFGTTTVTLRNDAPVRGEPPIVIGPNVHRIDVDGEAYRPQAGDEVHVLSTWCPSDCPLVQAERDGADIGLRPGSELGRGFWYDYAVTGSRSSTTLRVTTRRDGVWDGDLGSGRYRLTILPQTTIEPTEFSVTIRPPEGTEIVWGTQGVEIAGDGTATWRGSPEGATAIEVRFQAPLPLRWWRDLNGWLS